MTSPNTPYYWAFKATLAEIVEAENAIPCAGMTAPTPPAVSDVLREALALREGLICVEQYLMEAEFDEAVEAVHRAYVALGPDGPIASEIARLTGERDAMDRDVTDMMWQRRRAEERAEAAEAETARLRAALEKIAAMTEREYFGDQEYVYGKSQPYRERPTPAAQIARTALSSQEKTDA